jgi:hypothetical protein
MIYASVQFSVCGLGGLVSECPGPARVVAGVRELAVYRSQAESVGALGHPARVRVLALLGGCGLAVGELQGTLVLGSSGVSQRRAHSFPPCDPKAVRADTADSGGSRIGAC